MQTKGSEDTTLWELEKNMRHHSKSISIDLLQWHYRPIPTESPRYPAQKNWKKTTHQKQMKNEHTYMFILQEGHICFLSLYKL